MSGFVWSAVKSMFDILFDKIEEWETHQILTVKKIKQVYFWSFCLEDKKQIIKLHFELISL